MLGAPSKLASLGQQFANAMPRIRGWGDLDKTEDLVGMRRTWARSCRATRMLREIRQNLGHSPSHEDSCQGSLKDSYLA